MPHDPSRSRRRDREAERRRKAERRHRRQEQIEDAAEAAGDFVDVAGSGAELAGGGVPTPGFGGGRGGGRCDGCDGVGRGGGRGGDGCDACDCNFPLLHLAAVALFAPLGRRPRRGRVAGPRLSTLLLLCAAVLPPAAGGAVAAAIRLYRRRLTRFTPACPAAPSCSAVALDAVTRLGARRGLRVAAERLRACGGTSR